MRKKWPWVVLIIVLVLLIVAAGAVVWIARGGLPKTSGSITADVNAPVEIYRDQYGVPHIIAENKEDLFFAQGYAQAQDRMWQMDMSRRGVGGKLSEILGEDFIDTDTFTLTVGFLRAAQKNYDILEPETLIFLESYAAGVSAYIDDNRGRLSPEFTLLGYTPEPWEPMDSLSIAVYMSWYLAGNMDSELFNYALIEQVGLELAEEIFPDYPDYGPIITAGESEGGGQASEDIVKGLVTLSRIADLGGRTKYVPGLGSNNWVISGDLAPGDGAILANDMHLGMGLPSIWHYSHLIVEEEINATGVMFPGLPGIIVGFNEQVAWGFTNTGPDVQDLYILELNPENPQQYLYMGQWVDAESVVETFQVKGEPEPREVDVMITHHGPVITNIIEDLEIPMSLRWTALEGTRQADLLPGVLTAGNWEEFIDAMDYFMTPTQNVVYADREGNIGYRANGLIPIRRSGSGLLPADGTTDAQEWIGYIPLDELPTLYNPPEGIIVTANHRVVDDDYPYFITSEWSPPYRAMSIWRELEGQDSFVLEDMIRGQSSVYNSQAEILGDVLIGALRAAELNETESEALVIFEEWLQEPLEAADEVGPSLYNTLYFYLLRQTFADEMGEDLYERFLHNRGATNAFDRMLLSGESGWFNNIDTAEQETRDDIIALAFSDAVAYLEETLGGSPETWAWGDLHTITFRHDMGSIDLLARFFNRGPYPIGGSFHTPANMSYQLTNPYGVTHSAPWRYMVDMSDRRGLDSLAIGISGHFLSDHYDDQLEMWLNKEYKEIIFEPEEVKALSEKLVLEPR